MSNILSQIFQSNLTVYFWSILNPYKSVDTYATYINTVYKIVDDPKNSKLKQIQFLTAFVLYYAFLNCLFYILPLSSTTRIIICDTVHLKLQGDHLYFIYATFSLMVAYFYFTIYISPNLKVNRYLFEALFIKNKNLICIPFRFIKTYRNVTINEIMINIAWTITNGLNLFQILLYFILTFIVINILRNTLKNFRLFVSFLGLTVFLPIHFFHLLNYLSFWFAYAHVLIHTASIALILFTYILIKLKQHYFSLKSTLSMQYQQLFDHQTNFRDSVNIYQMIFSVNELFSSIFLVFLLINMPINAFFLISLAFKKASPIFKVGAIGIALQQALCILMMHLFIAHLNSYIERGGQMLICFTGKNINCSFKCKLLIWLHSMRLYSEKPYGITYGKFALVTMKTYLQVKL